MGEKQLKYQADQAHTSSREQKVVKGGLSDGKQRDTGTRYK